MGDSVIGGVGISAAEMSPKVSEHNVTDVPEQFGDRVAAVRRKQ
ncbi:hypothetical protein [Nocardia sp. NPDC051833]